MWTLIDRCALLGMALGLLLMLQPWWALGFEIGFFVLLIMTCAQIVSSHCVGAASEQDAGGG